MPLPVPGLDGTYGQSCVVCLRGTDTGLGFGPGAAEWAVAGLLLLGLSEDEAGALISSATGSAPGDCSGWGGHRHRAGLSQLHVGKQAGRCRPRGRPAARRAAVRPSALISQARTALAGVSPRT
jgi:hypothetical protein